MVLPCPHGSNRKKLRYTAPYHVHLNRTGSNGHPGPYLFADVALGPRSIATACHHHDDDYMNARTERKARNRKHLRAFSFYFHTSRYCNPTPPFAYYKRGGRDHQQERRDNT
jgi:hypothetical protein